MRKKQFKAESKRLLDLMINSIYTNKEIFLRELISNASDAIDKLCYISLTDQNVGMNREDFKIVLTPDAEARTLTISDNGVGMTADELEQNLGTIAKSGSKLFKDSLEGENSEAIDIIGQFGVGFYSAFMVADKVVVVSRAYGEDTANMWTSDGADGYTIEPCDKENVGTDITLYIKPDSEGEDYGQYLDRWHLDMLVRKYSNYIRWPIIMEMEKSEQVEVDGKKETVTHLEPETLNSMVPIWQKPKKEVTDEQYNEFYREKFYDYDPPVKVISVSAEGAVTYKALLFIPEKAPYDFYTKDFEKGLQLYSSGVLIMDKCADLLPDYFRFVRGVVDSSDLSLNLSREMLQHDRRLNVIATNLEKKIKSELKKMLESEREKYEKFWNSFGTQLKYGVVSDFGQHKDQLRDLLLFRSSASDKWTTLTEYVGRMGDEQKYIYYATGQSLGKIESLPQMEKLKDRGYEVLYLTENVDEFVLQILVNEDGKEFRSINGNEDLGLSSEEEKQEIEKERKDNQDLTDFIKNTLGDKVKEVRVSDKLSKHPVCMTAGGPMSFEMEKYMNALGEQTPMKAERILEINPEHPALKALRENMASDEDRAKKYAEILYCQALISADLPLDDVSKYMEMVCDLMN